MRILLAAIYTSSLILGTQAFAADTAVTGVSENTVSTTPSVQDASSSASKSNSTGQVMSVLTGGMLATQSAAHFGACSSTKWDECVKGAITAAMAVMSMKQAKEHGSVASASGLTSTLTNGTDPYSSGTYDPTVTTSTDPEVVAATNAFNKLKGSGVINTAKGTITTPTGKEYKISDLTSASGMASAGIPAGAIKGAMANAAALSEKALEKAEKIVGKDTASEDSFGGGGGSTTVVAMDDEASGRGGLGGGRGSVLKRDPAQLAGMQKNYNGEPIGVAADSIFLMMNRRYQVKQSQDSFLTEMDLRLQK